MKKRYRQLIEAILLYDTTWHSLDADAGMALWRQLADHYPGDTGFRSSERTVDLLFRVADWLRERKKIPLDACLRPSDWAATSIRPTQSTPDSLRPWWITGNPTRPRIDSANCSRRVVVGIIGVEFINVVIQHKQHEFFIGVIIVDVIANQRTAEANNNILILDFCGINHQIYQI